MEVQSLPLFTLVHLTAFQHLAQSNLQINSQKSEDGTSYHKQDSKLPVFNMFPPLNPFEVKVWTFIVHIQHPPLSPNEQRSLAAHVKTLADQIFISFVLSFFAYTIQFVPFVDTLFQFIPHLCLIQLLPTSPIRCEICTVTYHFYIISRILICICPLVNFNNNGIEWHKVEHIQSSSMNANHDIGFRDKESLLLYGHFFLCTVKVGND
mmetsp:Transcript_6368/g.11342  ORF Transcript_6368/g.11342 Transcript_6368/m.11342 type:complete len:208 (+) Transcript_6368:138-761(+)